MVREGRGRRVVSAVAIFLTAVALQQACTVAWAHATAESGARYELSVVGLSRLNAPPDAPRTDCRWWPKYGSTELCAPPAGQASAQGALRRAYPCLQVALWLAILSVLLQTLRVPRRRALQAGVPAVAAGLVAVAIYSMLIGASDGLAVLAPLEVRFSGRGFVLAVVAILLSGASAVLLLTSFVPGASADVAAGSSACARRWRMSPACTGSARFARRCHSTGIVFSSLALALVITVSLTSRPLDAQQSTPPATARPSQVLAPIPMPPDSGLADQRAFETLPLPVREVLDVRRELQPQGRRSQPHVRPAQQHIGRKPATARAGEALRSRSRGLHSRHPRGDAGAGGVRAAAPRRIAARLHLGRRGRCDGGDGMAAGFNAGRVAPGSARRADSPRAPRTRAHRAHVDMRRPMTLATTDATR